jgi:hypothetical protein
MNSDKTMFSEVSRIIENGKIVYTEDNPELLK